MSGKRYVPRVRSYRDKEGISHISVSNDEQRNEKTHYKRNMENEKNYSNLSKHIKNLSPAIKIVEAESVTSEVETKWNKENFIKRVEGDT